MATTKHTKGEVKCIKLQKKDMIKWQLRFPDVISDLILSYDYDFDGTLDWGFSRALTVHQVAGFPDGRVVAVSGRCVEVWDGATGISLWKSQSESGVQNIKVLAGDMLLVQSVDFWTDVGEMVFFDSNTYNRLYSFPITGASGRIEVLQPHVAEVDDTVRIVSFSRGMRKFEFFAYRRGGAPILPQQFDLGEDTMIWLSSVLSNNKFVIIAKSSHRHTHRIYLFQCSLANEISQIYSRGFSLLERDVTMSFCVTTSDDGVLLGGSCCQGSLQHGCLVLIKDGNTMQEIVLEESSIVSPGIFISQSRVLCLPTIVSAVDFTPKDLLSFDLAASKWESYDPQRHRFALLPNHDLVLSDTCCCRATDFSVYNTAGNCRTIHIAEPSAELGGANKHVSVAACKSYFADSLTVLPDGRLACFGYGVKIYS